MAPQRYEQRGEWGGFCVYEARTGWVVAYWSAIQGQLTGLRVLLPYGTAGYKRGADLQGLIKPAVRWTGEVASEGEPLGSILETLACDPSATRVLRRGWKVQ